MVITLVDKNMLNIKLEGQFFLNELSAKIVAQDKRGTSYPLFVVFDKVKIYREQGSETERKSDDFSEEEICPSCQKLNDAGEEMPEECGECAEECFVRFDWEEQIQENHGVFFTAEACDNYIASRHYEFFKAYSYAISAYWSEEMKRVMEILVSLTTNESLLK